MIRPFSFWASLLLLAQIFFLPASQAATPADHQGPPPASDSTDANIAQIEAEMLQNWQYAQHPFDQEISGKMLDLYLETLDYSHLYFLQSDINEFEKYRTNLQVLTLRDSDMSPCWTIFSRFMQRAGERVTFTTNFLATAKFEFEGHERFTVNRHSLPYAKDMNEAHEFWRQVARCEYLDQLLGAQPIEFTGKISFETNQSHKAPVTAKSVFLWDKGRVLDYEFFPTVLAGKDGRSLGPVRTAPSGTNGTNFILTLPWHKDATWTHLTNALYSHNTKIGELRLHRSATFFESTTNGTVTNSSHWATNYSAVIHLDQTNFAAIPKNTITRYGQMLDNYKELESDRIFEMYMNALARAYDPHSEYMGHLQAENFAIQMKLSLFGIGAILTKDGNYCKISELKEGPAKKSGQIKDNDRIVAVAQSNAEPVDVVGMPLDKIVEMIRGPKGTQVSLTLIPVDAAETVRKEVTLIRDEIKLEENQPKARLYDIPSTNGSNLKLGVIDLASFFNDPAHPEVNTTINVKQLITRLQREKADGIILDLRHNGGGYLEEAIKLTGLFNPKGPVVQTKDPNGDIVADPSPEAGPLYDGPLIVLTSVLSASASEILAGALQDYGRALIVGDHATFGKGTVQTMQELSSWLDLKHKTYSYDPGQLKITIKKFYRAGGVSTQLQGVLSDVELPSIDDVADIGERSLPYAMPCDAVTPANHLEELQLNRVKPYLTELQARSKQRVDQEKDFSYIREDMAEYRKEQADKSLSLNKAERISEQKTLLARAEARKKERLSRKKSNEKAYEITLKNIDLAVLQPLTVKTNAATMARHDAAVEAGNDELSSDEPTLDPTLEETKRILADYIQLLKKGPGISQTDAR